MRKVLFVLVIVAVALTPAFAEGQQETGEKETYKIGAAVYGLQAEYMRL